MKKRILLGALLFIIGLAGVLSLLLVDIPLKSIPKEALEMFSPEALKWLILINPAILLLISVIIGILSFNKVGLKLPILGKLIGFNDETIGWKEILIYGIGIGTLAGFLITLISQIFELLLPIEFKALNQEIHLHLLSKILYGGITEEILLRFGLMSLLVYLGSFMFKKKVSFKFWFGIILSAFLFGLGHLPIVFKALAHPGATLIFYIIVGNGIAGVLFGWLYWKKGLESAMIAHIVTHLCLLFLENMIK